MERALFLPRLFSAFVLRETGSREDERERRSGGKDGTKEERERVIIRLWDVTSLRANSVTIYTAVARRKIKKEKFKRLKLLSRKKEGNMHHTVIDARSNSNSGS